MPEETAVIPKLEDMQEQLYIPEPLRRRMATAGKEIEGETRLVTVLFADISGFTPASEELSPEELADMLNQCFKGIVDTICHYEGSVNRFIGDCVLAFFGAPIAHENDPEDAIRAALAMREKLAGFNRNISVGINTGMMYIGPIGTDLHKEFTAEGYHINLAKRLQEVAGPGQIIVGESTFKFTQRTFAFERLPPLSLKGIHQPVRAYGVIRPLEHPEKLRGIEGLQAKLIGREKEFAALIDATEALVGERKGQIATVVGEAGIGKSRLVSELKDHLKGKEVHWLEGRCISIGQSVGFWPFVDMMRTYLGITSEDREQEMVDKLVQQMNTLFGREADGIIPYIGQMLSIELPERYQERIRYAAPEQIRHQTLLRMRDVFVALTRQQPLLLILEDLHWADDLSLDLLWVLLDELVAVPMMVICVYRPEREHGSGQIDSMVSSKCLERYTPISLKPLTPQQSQEMVASMLAIENLPAETRTAILEKTEGNPFFVEEVIRFLIERGIIMQEEGRWKVHESMTELAVPDTIQSVILSRIDRLHEEVKSVLQCASIIGRVFQHRLLGYLSGQEEILEECLSELEANGLVYKERIVPELEYAFKHALTQETTYQGLLSRQRRMFHERAGQGIETLYQEQIEEHYEQLAYHYGRSENQEKAVEYQVKAGQKAARRYAHQEALDYFGKALELAQEGESYDRILMHRAQLLLDLFRGKEAARDYEHLLNSAKDSRSPEQELEALLGLAWACYVIALDAQTLDYASRSRELYEAAYALARELDDKPGMVRALIPTRWFVDFWLEYRDQAVAHVEEALALSQEIGDEGLIIDSKMAMLSFLKPFEAEEQAEALRRQLEARQDLVKLKDLYFTLGWVHDGCGHFEKGIEVCDAGIRLAGETGVPPVQFPTWKAFRLLHLGRYDAAWESLQREVADEVHRLGRALKDLGTGRYFLELMAYEKAVGFFESAEEQGRRLGRVWMRRQAQVERAKALLWSGKLSPTHLDSISQDLESIGTALPAAVRGEIDLAEGRLDEALLQAEKACAEDEESGRQPAYVSALELRLRVLVQLGRTEEGIALADEGIRLAEEMCYRPMVWRLRATKAQALDRLGNAEAAAQEYGAAAEGIRKLVDTIPDAELQHGFMSNPVVSLIMEASQ